MRFPKLLGKVIFVDPIRGRAVAGVVYVIAAAFAVSGLTACDAVGQQTGDPRRESSASSTANHADATRDVVKVRGVGFSVGYDTAKRVRVSYGVVIENVGNRVADQVTLVIRLLDASGNALQFADEEFMSKPSTEYRRDLSALPHEGQIGLGGYAYLAPEEERHRLSDVARVDARVVSVQWWQRAEVYPRVRLGISEIDARRKDGNAAIEFTLHSPCSVAMQGRRAGLEVVFYDQAGEVVGGDALALESEWIPSGTSRQIAYSHLPDTTDLERTEVYAHGVCDRT